MKLRIGVPLFILLLALAGSTALLLAGASRGTELPPAAPTHSAHVMAMSDAEMAQMSARWFAAHPPTGAEANAPAVVAAVSETVTVQNFVFDADKDLINTPIDTVKIALGDEVVWKFVSGLHTTTSGTGAADPQVGVLWNQPIDSAHLFFAHTFNSAGVFPYFCSNHEFLNMRGYVKVQDLTGVGDTPVGTGIGFAAHPWPNPTRGAVSFRYDVRQAGPVRALVVDARGRVVSLLVNEDQPAGAYTRSWDGRTRGGALAATGRYFLRLVVPGYVGTQAITLAR